MDISLVGAELGLGGAQFKKVISKEEGLSDLFVGRSEQWIKFTRQIARARYYGKPFTRIVSFSPYFKKDTYKAGTQIHKLRLRGVNSLAQADSW